jgi:hypothetical protein
VRRGERPAEDLGEVERVGDRGPEVAAGGPGPGEPPVEGLELRSEPAELGRDVPLRGASPQQKEHGEDAEQDEQTDDSRN